MRILFNCVTAFQQRTGVGQYTACLSQALQRVAADRLIPVPAGIPDLLASSLRSFIGQRFASRGAAVSTLWTAHHWLRRDARQLLELSFARIARREQPDLYHEPNYVPWPCETPAVINVHDLSVLLHPEWHPPARVAHHQNQFDAGLKTARHVITGTQQIRGEIIRYLGVAPERVTSIPNGVRPEFRPMAPSAVQGVRRRLGLPGQYLLHVGAIEPRKNLLMLIRAYCSLRRWLRVRCPLVLVGPWGWNHDDVGKLFESTARKEGVVHIGYVSDGDLPAVYNGARALVYPTHYEGFGLPPIEMMACGGPVLASTAGAVRETCGDFAHLIHARDEAGWRDGMKRIIDDDDWHEELRRGVVRHAAGFSWAQCAQLTWQTYERILKPALRPVAAAA